MYLVRCTFWRMFKHLVNITLAFRGFVFTQVVCVFLQNRTEARRVMQGKNPPQNCSQAFSKEGDQIFINRSYTAEQTRANYLSGDVEEEIRFVWVCGCVQ